MTPKPKVKFPSQHGKNVHMEKLQEIYRKEKLDKQTEGQNGELRNTSIHTWSNDFLSIVV